MIIGEVQPSVIARAYTTRAYTVKSQTLFFSAENKEAINFWSETLLGVCFDSLDQENSLGQEDNIFTFFLVPISNFMDLGLHNLVPKEIISLMFEML